MDFPAELKYTKDHEWVRADGKQYTVGITEFAQSELGEIVFVELPSIGRELKAGETLCVVESTKAASDVYAPVSGKVVEVNSKLQDSPDLVNSNPYGDGWMVKFEAVNEAELSGLMDSGAYASSVAS